MVKPFFGPLAPWGVLDGASCLLLALPLAEPERLEAAGGERAIGQ
jgi:hypothetical protein